MGVETTLLDPRKADKDDHDHRIGADRHPQPEPDGNRHRGGGLRAAVRAAVLHPARDQPCSSAMRSIRWCPGLPAARRATRDRGRGRVAAGRRQHRRRARTACATRPPRSCSNCRRPHSACARQSARTARRTVAAPSSRCRRPPRSCRRRRARPPRRPPPPKGVLRVQVEEPAVKVSDYLWWSSASILAFVGQAVSVLFLVYFMLMSGDLFKRKLVQVTGPDADEKEDHGADPRRDLRADRALPASCRCSRACWSAWRAGPHSGSSVSSRRASGRSPAGMFNSIPYFGPVVVTGGIAVVAFLQFGTVGDGRLRRRLSHWRSPAWKAFCSRRG